MNNNLPQLRLKASREGCEQQTHRHKTKATQKINVKGITLREYFQLCSQNQSKEKQQPLQDYYTKSSRSSLAETPTFKKQTAKKNLRIKVKTQISSENSNSVTKIQVPKINLRQKVISNKSMSINESQPAQIKVNPLQQLYNDRKSSKKKLMMNFLPANEKYKSQCNDKKQDNSIRIEVNRNKTLKRIVMETDRINQAKPNHIGISKYASRFRIVTREEFKDRLKPSVV